MFKGHKTTTEESVKDLISNCFPDMREPFHTWFLLKKAFPKTPLMPQKIRNFGDHYQRTNEHMAHSSLPAKVEALQASTRQQTHGKKHGRSGRVLPMVYLPT